MLRFPKVLRPLWYHHAQSKRQRTGAVQDLADLPAPLDGLKWDETSNLSTKRMGMEFSDGLKAAIADCNNFLFCLAICAIWTV